ncbi:MAG: hypothetical protein VB119_10975 [Candidatus Metalachnospira sp.]|nr:hypothetical protein [Candidatus Metalachnospira sp.]
MKWSQIESDDWVHIPFDENERAVKGSALVSWGMNLEDVPNECFDICIRYDSKGKQFSAYSEERVQLSDIVGSSYDMYSDIPWIVAYQKIKRASTYILQGDTTIGKYKWQLKKPCIEQWNKIELTRTNNGLYIDGNGNHRVIIYKMMMFSELSSKRYTELSAICKQYWLKAMVRNE